MHLPHFHFPLPSLRPFLWPAVVGLIAGLVILWQVGLNNQLQTEVDGVDERVAVELQLQAMQQQVLLEQQATLSAQLASLQSEPTQQKYATIEALLVQYKDISGKVERNSAVKLDVSIVTNQYADWGQKLLAQQFDELKTSLSSGEEQLDKDYQSYQASLVPKTSSPSKSSSSSGGGSNPSGYSTQSVSTSRGTFSVKLIKMALNSVTVKTVAANSSNCTNNCPAKTLAQYVQENGAYAGIHGSYFCPPDYSACTNKKYSYDFPVYNTNLGKWLNQGALGWNSPGLATFKGHSATFYKSANQFPGGNVTAAIGNFPTLLVQNGSVAITDANLDSAQKNKGVRGALGVDGSNVYLAIISSASVLDAAYAMQALGATQVLNLDGGGSQAMYIGGAYKAGPGRLLPNAIVLVP